MRDAAIEKQHHSTACMLPKGRMKVMRRFVRGPECSSFAGSNLECAPGARESYQEEAYGGFVVFR